MSDDIARVQPIALDLPGSEEKSSHGCPAFYVQGKPFARIHEQPGVLLLWRPSILDREELIAAEPAKFFTTDHYRDHPSVLVCLETVEDEDLRVLVERMLRSSGRRLDLSSPFVDALLPDGSRLHVVIPSVTRTHWRRAPGSAADWCHGRRPPRLEPRSPSRPRRRS